MMIHPQPTVVLMLLWEARVGVSRDDIERPEFLTAEQLSPRPVHRARDFRLLTDAQEAQAASRAATPVATAAATGTGTGTRVRLRLRRRGPVVLRRLRVPRRPACSTDRGWRN
jgi:hypothetical protein